MPLSAAHNITELFILCGKNQVSSLFAASTNKIFAKSTIGINETHAIVALIKKIIQKTVLPFVDYLGKGSGTGFINDLKKLNLRMDFVKGIIISKETTIFIKVKNSLSCQIWFDELILFGKPNTVSK